MTRILTDYAVTELEAAIRAIRQRELDDAKALRDSVTPVVEFTLSLVTDGFSVDKLFTDTHVWYRLAARTVNADEARAAGHDVKDGGMNYLFDRTNNQFVMSGGGGIVYLTSDARYRRDADEAQIKASFHKVLARLAATVATSPNGGDVTQIILDHRAEVAAAITK